MCGIHPLPWPTVGELPEWVVACEAYVVTVFQPRSADDLTVLRAGMCPDCGAGVYQGITACGACGLSFANHLAELPPRRGAKPASTAPATRVLPETRSGLVGQAPAGVPLSVEALSDLERGPLQAHLQPLTEAEGPDVASGDTSPRLGSALSRAAVVVMADAAVADDPLVLLGYPPGQSHVARAMINQRRAEAADDDEPAQLLRTSSPPRAVVSAQRRGDEKDRRLRRDDVDPLYGVPLTLADIERLEQLLPAWLPHSFAELAELTDDVVKGRVADPALGAALIRGGNTTLAEAAIGDEPLVLLGYPPVTPRDVPRLAINLRRTDAGYVDEVESLLVRPQARPKTATRVSSGRAAPAIGVDRAAIQEAQATVGQASTSTTPRPPGSARVQGRGAVQTLDD